MKKTLLICITFLLSFSLSQAQTDTTKYDLGRLQMDKKLTQAITIKAADLEKMPFTSLADAINIWLYGVYGGQQNFVPVVDGIVMTDVNALSIYDIDEITLVQNAATVLNGAAPRQLLLLIKTRRNRPGKSGIEAAGQTNWISIHNDQSTKNNTRFYNQYYLSGYVNTSKINAGISADFQRDATPANFQNSSLTYNGYTATLNRYKFNGYMDATLGSSSILSLSVGYVPQNGDGSAYGYQFTPSVITTSSTINTIKEKLYYNNISLKSSFSGFKNTFTGGYQHFTATDSTALNQSTNTTGPSYSKLQKTTNDNINDNVLIKDNLSYAFKSGDWEIEPNINFMYRHYKTSGVQTFEYLFTDAGGSALLDSSTLASKDATIKQSILTPALNINYHNALMLQGGVQIMLSGPEGNTQAFKPKRAYPFASAMLNITALAGKQNSSTGLSIFGSFANVNSYMADIHDYISSISTAASYDDFTTLYSPIINSTVNPYKASNQWQAGANFSLFHNKLAFSYNYSNRQLNYMEAYYYSIPSGTITNYNLSNNKISSHRFGFDINWAKSNKFSWETNLNTSFIQTNIALYELGFTQTVKNHLVTGGFINRLNYKKAFLGADVLYILHDNSSYTLSTYTTNYHAFNLQNLYVGFKVNVKNIKNLEIYANARNLVEGKNTALLDTRKFYGLGFKLGL